MRHAYHRSITSRTLVRRFGVLAGRMTWNEFGEDKSDEVSVKQGIKREAETSLSRGYCKYELFSVWGAFEVRNPTAKLLDPNRRMSLLLSPVNINSNTIIINLT